jgi:asparagine synthase (glutamine-hydrolysing)
MSVQAGIWNFDGEPASGDFLLRVSHASEVYGPDGESILKEGPIGMLYRPLHTTEESYVEHQPHVCPSGRVLTWDGRLDNRDELISHLGDELNGDRTDVAIVAAAFDRWATDSFRRLIGDWALVIWDSHEQELILARDYIGIRHLFYYPGPKRLRWCTQLRPLALCGDRFNICDEYIASYLAFHPDAHLTPYREIYSVPPGKCVRIKAARATVQTYWTFDPSRRISYRSDAEYQEQFRGLFRQSVRRRLRTNSKILADLSGGLDSTSILVVADHIITEKGTGVPRIDTFSWYDLDEPDEEDFPYITKVEETRGRVGHHANIRSIGDTLCFEYPEFVATPGFDGREEVNGAYRDVAKGSKYRVSLSGHGGDEINGQALDFRVQIADFLWRRQIREAGKHLFTWSLRSRYPLVQLLAQSSNLLLPRSLRFGKRRMLCETVPWINGEFARKHKMSDHLLTAAHGSWRWLPSTRDTLQTIENLSRDMTNQRPSAIEKRYPYLDQELTEFMMAIPTNQVLRPGSRRSLQRRALSHLLPPEIVARKTKTSTGRCVSVTLQKHSTSLDNIFGSPLVSRLGYIDQASFHDTLQRFKSGQLSSVVRTMRALSLELWLLDAMDRGVISVSTPPSATLTTRMRKPASIRFSSERDPRCSQNLEK